MFDVYRYVYICTTIPSPFCPAFLNISAIHSIYPLYLWLSSNVETLVNCNTQLLKDWDDRKRHSSTKDDVVIMGDIFQKMVHIYNNIESLLSSSSSSSSSITIRITDWLVLCSLFNSSSILSILSLSSTMNSLPISRCIPYIVPINPMLCWNWKNIKRNPNSLELSRYVISLSLST